MIDVKDEILGGEPLYRIRDNNGNIKVDNCTIEMITEVLQEGTPINKALFDSIAVDIAEQTIFGTYTGNSSESQNIELGFKPSLVIISAIAKGYVYSSGCLSRDNFGIIGPDGFEESYNAGNSVYYSAEKHVLTDTGFTVNKLKRTYDGEIQYSDACGLNMNGQVYNYIAFK